ncbi:phosphotransferase enzyme family protein [Kribbella sp. NPDC049174]|uniref:phosphotransferase enzyme family protein n=1 Tax=Kribbella sp. NPDC049174 TaxID=3364112 RepID=UPI00371034E4
MSAASDDEEQLAKTLDLAYDVQPAEITRIAAGTSTINYRVTDHAGAQWFAKIYRDRAALRREYDAVELAEYARAGRVPVPRLRPTRKARLIEDAALPMSLWEYVADAETAEAGIVGGRWQAVGAVLGRLHRHLADHPAAAPTVRPATGVSDIERSRARFDRLISEYSRRKTPSPFEAWALDAVRQRRALLDRAAVILADLPDLTVQIVHGDLASPNLLLRADQVAAVIDFQPPTPRYLSWEIARIGCDPRTILLGDQWITGFPELLAAYQDEHPTVRPEDLTSAVAVGCAYMLASTYPLSEHLDNPTAVEPSLQTYARARHEAALLMLDRLDEVHRGR